MNARVLAEGGAGTPLVYVPGIDGTGELLLGLTPRLEACFRLVRLAYDVREPRADGYAELAASVAEVVRARGVARCLVLCESFGGAVGLQLALDAPELVAGVCVVNSFAYYPERGRLALARGLSPLVPEAAFHFGRRWLAPRNLFGRRRDRAALEAFRALPGNFFDEGYERRLDMIRALDLRPRLGELRQPVALYAGDADRIVPSVECLGEVHALVHQATLDVLPGGGHLVLPLAAEPWPERLQELGRRAGF
ncbi:MAG: alpha/beta hydrolase [Planctomycetes bacterium]|nr:alpha/beta hydrolase [Planctomycetota bacterium]